MNIQFDSTIELGTVLHLIGFVVTVMIAYFGVIRRMDKIDIENREAHKGINEKLNMLWNHFLQEKAKGDME